MKTQTTLLESAEAALALITDSGEQGGKTWTVKALTNAIDREKMIEVCSYRVKGRPAHDEITIENVRQPDGPDRWAIRKGGSCLAKDGNWEFEPLPSSRSEAFFMRCRYATLESALETIKTTNPH